MVSPAQIREYMIGAFWSKYLNQNNQNFEQKKWKKFQMHTKN